MKTPAHKLQQVRERYAFRRNHPELCFCQCGNRAAHHHCGDVVCERCYRIEKAMLYQSDFAGVQAERTSATSRMVSAAPGKFDLLDLKRIEVGASLVYLERLMRAA